MRPLDYAMQFDNFADKFERRKLYFRACHRGIKEMDLILSRFAVLMLPQLDAAGLADFARILELPDDQLYAWATQRKPVPETCKSPLLDALLKLDYMDMPIVDNTDNEGA